MFQRGRVFCGWKGNGNAGKEERRKGREGLKWLRKTRIHHIMPYRMFKVYSKANKKKIRWRQISKYVGKLVKSLKWPSISVTHVLFLAARFLVNKVIHKIIEGRQWGRTHWLEHLYIAGIAIQRLPVWFSDVLLFWWNTSTVPHQ